MTAHTEESLMALADQWAEGEPGCVPARDALRLAIREVLAEREKLNATVDAVIAEQEKAMARAEKAEAQMEIERLRTALENMRRELNRAWREVDFIAKERTEHLEWRTKLANDLGECELIRDALGRALNKRENDLMLLRNAVDAMMAHLGYHGEISARGDRVQAVMDALAKIDAKEGT